MKTIKYILSLGILCVLLIHTGCEDVLDIEPKDDINSSGALLTSGDVQGALIGAYTGAGLQGLYGGRILVSSDLLADDGDISFYGTYQAYSQLADKEILNNNTFTETAWANAYLTINTCNNVLQAINLVTAANKNRVEGEAKFLRGMIYFDLARLYGKAWNDGNPSSNLAVPIVLAPTTTINESNNVKRNTVAEVYAQAIADLTDAATKLPTTNGFFANRYAASAVLSRIYLTQERFADAEAEADKVINPNRFSLVEDFTEEWPNPTPAGRVSNTTEDIFAIQVSNQAGTNALNEVYASATFGGRGDIEINDQHVDRYEADDERTNIFYNDNGSIRTGKHSNVYGNIKLIRLAEVYLNRAEARIRKSVPNITGALEDLNIVRRRAGLNDLISLDPVEILDAIKAERIVELSFEGFRLHDAKRYKENIATLPYNDNKLVFPIPQREIEANPNLKQNPGYN